VPALAADLVRQHVGVMAVVGINGVRAARVAYLIARAVRHVLAGI
jgi:hypothetical protein